MYPTLFPPASIVSKTPGSRGRSLFIVHCPFSIDHCHGGEGDDGGDFSDTLRTLSPSHNDCLIVGSKTRSLGFPASWEYQRVSLRTGMQLSGRRRTSGIFRQGTSGRHVSFAMRLWNVRKRFTSLRRLVYVVALKCRLIA